MTTSLFQTLEKSLLKNKDQPIFQIKRGLRRETWTGEKVLEDIKVIQAFFTREGIKKGDKIMIWAPNMPEWSLLFLACIKTGVIAVPVDFRSGWNTIEKYINLTKIKGAFVGNDLLPFFKSAVPHFRLESVLVESGSQTINEEEAIKPDDIVEIIFTSGSTSEPKGVVLTHRNFLVQIEQTEDFIPPIEKYETVSILPLSHLYGELYDLILPVYKGGLIHYLPRVNPLTIKKELRNSKATYLMTVPQILRIFQSEIEQNVKGNKEVIFNALLKISSHLPKCLSRLVFYPVQKQFGGNLKILVSGSAPLEPKLAKFWEAMGFVVIEGYGATETTGVATALPWKKRKFGTVGIPAKYAKIKIQNDKEILVKGPMLSPGYFGDEKKTREAFENGWYKTADLGEMDNGFLRIIGRKSSRIVLSDGTKVYPEDIERKLNNDSAVKDSCVIEGKEENESIVHAFILPKDREKTDLGKIISKINETLESKQQIQSFSLWNGKDFPRLKTLKIDRTKVKGSYFDEKKNHEPEEKNQTYDINSICSLIKSLTMKGEISEEKKLGEDLHLDSLKRIQLAAMIEQNLGVVIPDLVLTSQTTIKELTEIIKKEGNRPNANPTPDVLNHWRFSKLAKLARPIFQKTVIFPLHQRWVNVEIEKGKEILAKMSSPSLIIFNHIGMFDLVTVLRVLPKRILERVTTAVTNERWDDRNRPVSFLIDLGICGYPFAREGPMAHLGLEATGELADKGYSIILAPEGTMERERVLQPFRPGLGLLAKELKIPVIMFKISDEYRNIWPAPDPGIYATEKKYFFPKNRGKIKLRIGKASIPDSLSYEETASLIRDQFVKL